ncbi:MAG: ATP-binding protein [Gemmatimonadota bacterium]
MKNWFDIAVPHEDIRKGGFDEAVFAADLGDVADGRAASDYGDAYLFYRKTYPTEGLRTLLGAVHRKLTEGEGPGAVELQTPFGGGKTHALVSVYHYLKSGAKIAELLPDDVEVLAEPPLAVVVGTQLNPLKGRTSDGVTRRTLWGELAYQLGGVEAYRTLEDNDKGLVTPGKEALREVLEPLQPFVILFDEILEYIVKARGVEVQDATLGAQTLTFFKELTDTVAGLPKALMIATLPSSELEDFGEVEQLNLGKLEHIFDRVKTIATPVEGDEVYSIIRRRLFEPVKDEKVVRAIAQSYVDTYQENRNELPPKARSTEFRRKIELAYPFHPDVIDILQEKWGTFATFQRTRGVLRLLAHVVEDLWKGRENLDLILPGDLNLDRSNIRREFLGHIGQQHDGVVTSDISGDDSKSSLMDRENHGWHGLAERIATTVFLHSFSANDMEIGASLNYIKLGVLRPDTVAPLITEVLQKQRAELWYLNSRDDRYYFSSVPNLNRMVLDRKGAVSTDAIRTELERRIKKELGNRFRCFLWPDSSAAIPDNTDLKLAVIDPASGLSHQDLEGWLERRGEGFRSYKNTVFFAYPEDTGYGRIREDVRTILALKDIEEEIQRGDRPGLEEKAGEVKRRIRDVEERIPQRVREMYRTVMVPSSGGKLERVDLGQPTVGGENLDTWYLRELTEPPHQKILSSPPSATMLRAKFVSQASAVALSTVREQFRKDPGLPLPQDDQLIQEAVVAAVANGDLGIARESADEIRPDTVRFDEPVAASTVELDEDTFLLSADRARELKAKVEADSGEGGDSSGAPETDDGQAEVKPTKGGESQTTIDLDDAKGADEKLKTLRIRASGIPVGRLADLNRGVLMPLMREIGAFEFVIELDLAGKDGISKRVVEQQVMETLKQIGAKVEKPG